MLKEFPVIHTNVWDAMWGVPVVLAVVLLAKWLFNIPLTWLSTLSTVVALGISIFISHPKNLSAGVFMGFFYSGAAMGMIYSTKQSFLAYRKR